MVLPLILKCLDQKKAGNPYSRDCLHFLQLLPPPWPSDPPHATWDCCVCDQDGTPGQASTLEAGTLEAGLKVELRRFTCFQFWFSIWIASTPNASRSETNFFCNFKSFKKCSSGTSKLTSLGAYSDQFSSYSTSLSTSLCRKLMRKEAAIEVNCVPFEHF